MQVNWDESPGENVDHLAEHGITPAEAEDVLLDDRIKTAFSNSSGSPCKFGETSTGKYIIVIWIEVDDNPRTIYPVTAYEEPRPARRKK